MRIMIKMYLIQIENIFVDLNGGNAILSKILWISWIKERRPQNYPENSLPLGNRKIKSRNLIKKEQDYIWD